jgi:hypothetical protein
MKINSKSQQKQKNFNSFSKDCRSKRSGAKRAEYKGGVESGFYPIGRRFQASTPSLSRKRRPASAASFAAEITRGN